MSTNKTENYGLHAWVAGDDFLREEMNENFALIDETLLEVTFGTYIGDQAEGKENIRTIELGFQPRAVFIIPQNGRLALDGGRRAGGLFTATFPLCEPGKEDQWAAHITPTGFEYRNKEFTFPNYVGFHFLYCALR